MKKYVTKDEAITREIKPALGQFAKEHDLEAIASEALEYDNGFFHVAVDEDEFWDIVERAAQ